MTTKEFVEKASQNEELAKKMKACKKPEEAYEAAKEAGLTDDYDAFTKYMTELNEKLSQELSDEELENAAGGLSDAEAAGIGAAAGVGVFVGSIAVSAAL